MSSEQAAWEFPPYTAVTHRSSYPAIDPKNPANSALGKVVVVTGGGTSIGLATARAFVDAGAATVAITGRRANVLASAKTELEHSGKAKILTYPVDAIDEFGMKDAFKSIEREAGKIDIVIANAGIMGGKELAVTANLDEWWSASEVNIKGSLITYRAFHAHKSDNSPTFVSVNSAVCHAGTFSPFSAYTVSKAGLAQLIPFLHVENPEIRAVSLHPGVVESDMNSKSGMVLSRDDVSLPASFAVWLASPAADWTGGKFMWPHWDVEELVARKQEILASGELEMGLKGWPRSVETVVKA